MEPFSIGLKLIGLSGAEISFVAREAAYNCLRSNLDLVSIVKGDADEEVDIAPQSGV